jgi:hypothetical protein
VTRARAALATGASAVAMAALLGPPPAWPLLFWISLTLSTGAAAMAGGAGSSAASTSASPLGVLAAGAAVLGWYVLQHAHPALDGLPPPPEMGRLLDLPPAMGAAVASAGLYVVATGAGATGRIVAVAGAALLVAAGLYPQTVAGSLTMPIFGGTSLLALLLTAGGALVIWLVRQRPVTVSHLRYAGTALLCIAPAWLILHGSFISGLATLGEELLLGACLVIAAPLLGGEGTVLVPVAAEWAAVGVLSVAYWLLKIHGLGYSASDEYIYFYAARTWADGLWPYKDFFFSHPPLHIAVPAVLFRVFGFHHLLAKLIAPSTLFAAGLVLWRASRHHFGRWAGVATLTLFWFGMEVLRSSTTFTGVELTTLFLSAGIVAALDRRSFVAGLWCGAAVCTGVYGLAGFLTFVVLALAAPLREKTDRIPYGRHDAVRMTLGFLAVFLVINGTFLAIGGSHFVDGVYRYHLLKPAKNVEQHSLSDDPLAVLYNLIVLLQGRDVRMSLYYHALHYTLAVTALVIVGLGVRPGPSISWNPRTWWPSKPGGRNPEGAVMLLSLSALGTLAELGSLRERYDFYFTLLFPTLSMLGGFATAELLRRWNASLTTDPTKKQKAASDRWLWPAISFSIICLPVPIAHWANATAFPEEITAQGSSKGAGELLRFEWTPSPVAPALGEIAHGLFWSDTRVRGEIQTSVLHFLRTKKRYFEMAPTIAEYVNAHTTPEDTLTGASDYAPLVALLAHRRLAGNEVDTNSKVFITGIVREADFWDSVCQDRPAYLIAASNSYFAPSELPGKRAGSIFRYETTFEDHGLKQFRAFPIELWRRAHEPPESICD